MTGRNIRQTALAAAAICVALLSGCWQSTPDSALEQAKQHFSNGEWDLAIRTATEAIDQDPQSAVAYTYRGRAFHCQGDLARALEDFSTAIRLDPNYPEAYYDRAIAYKERGDRDKAMADERTARKIDPNYTKAFLFDPESYIEHSHLVPDVGDTGQKAKPADESNPRKFADDHENAKPKEKESEFDDLVRHANRGGKAGKSKGGSSAAAELPQRSMSEELFGVRIPHPTESGNQSGNGPDRFNSFGSLQRGDQNGQSAAADRTLKAPRLDTQPPNMRTGQLPSGFGGGPGQISRPQSPFPVGIRSTGLKEPGAGLGIGGLGQNGGPGGDRSVQTPYASPFASPGTSGYSNGAPLTQPFANRPTSPYAPAPASAGRNPFSPSAPAADFNDFGP